MPHPLSPWNVLAYAKGEPLPPTRRPPPGVMHRHFYYRRIRSSNECAYHMAFRAQSPVQAAFHLTAAWADPPGGMIPRPSSSDKVIPFSHAVFFSKGIPDKRLFEFQNTWSDWGDNGSGFMPHEYFDKYMIECWATYIEPAAIKLFKLEKPDTEGHVRWSAHDEEDRHIFAFEVRDARSEERFAWTFLIEREGVLEVEELYVRPEHRGQGQGRWLADRIVDLARHRIYRYECGSLSPTARPRVRRIIFRYWRSRAARGAISTVSGALGRLLGNDRKTRRSASYRTECS